MRYNKICKLSEVLGVAATQLLRRKKTGGFLFSKVGGWEK